MTGGRGETELAKLGRQLSTMKVCVADHVDEAFPHGHAHRVAAGRREVHSRAGGRAVKVRVPPCLQSTPRGVQIRHALERRIGVEWQTFEAILPVDLRRHHVR